MALAVVAFKERGGRAFSLSVGIPMQGEGWWHHPLSSCALMGEEVGERLEERERLWIESREVSVFGLSHVIVTDRLIGKRVHTGPPSHPISPPNQCDCTRFSVIFCCGMPLKLICSLSARKHTSRHLHLSCVSWNTSTPVLCLYFGCVCVLLVRNWPRVTRAPVVCRPIIITSSWHSDESRNISWLRSGLSAFHSGFVLRPLYMKSMRAVSNLESLHIKVIQC